MTPTRVKRTHAELTAMGVEALRRKHEATMSALDPVTRLMRELGGIKKEWRNDPCKRLQTLLKLAAEDRFWAVLNAATPQQRVKVLEVFAATWGQLQIARHEKEGPFFR